ncbi:glycine oxidase ThiO [Neptunomonas phycophila]|uniref:glycine oxidase ThiO n=1 Tax=Neptunomonas phycophila TaxID=1572645 RepID=UPI001BE7B8A5|nr:glycine oxidase ThiO [Neptunomonas phycophila]MBT3145841.1 glycine oxidase ThiO [Neptunomonas phycophila]
MSDFLVVGGGVIGLMLTRELALAGASVTLVERGTCAKEASWAGGGIVSPLYPWRYSSAVTQLATWSQSSYVHLAATLTEETSIDPELRQKGMYMVDVEDRDAALSWAAAYHRPLVAVEASHLYHHEPEFASGYESALWMPEVSSIRNPRLGQALRRSVMDLKQVTLQENTGVERFVVEGETVLGVQTSQGNITAGHTVVASGSWTGHLLGGLSISLPVEPVKGQMMVFKAEPNIVNRVILMGGRYVIPRSDGRILVGSTLEHEGFNKQITESARESLYQTAVGIIPRLADFPVEHHWAGLRPGSPEGIPFIGEVPGYQGISVNAGQYRNGLVLAPASTRLQADLLLGQTPVIDPSPYQLAGRLGSL